MDASTLEKITTHIDAGIARLGDSLLTRLLDGISANADAMEKMRLEKDRQLAEMNTELLSERKQKDEAYDSLTKINARVAELERKNSHSFEKGQQFEMYAIDRVRALLNHGTNGLTVEKLHSHAADMVVTMPLPELDCGRRSVKLLIECKHEEKPNHEAKYIQKLARDAHEQSADAAILLYSNIAPTLHDYATDGKKEHSKVGLCKEYMMMCDPTNLLPALARLLARVQPLDTSEHKEVFEARYRTAMKREYDAMAEWVDEQTPFLELFPCERLSFCLVCTSCELRRFNSGY